MMRILRGLSSRFLPCGCLVGIYETYDAATVAILDARSDSCVDPAHRTGQAVPVEGSTTRSSNRGAGVDARE